MKNLAIVLAAGKGKRMKSNLTKVLHKVTDKSMLIMVVEKLLNNNINKIIIVVSPINKEIIIDEIKSFINVELVKCIEFIIQEEQLGTGDAVKSCTNLLKQYESIYDNALVMFGDSPLITNKTINFINRLIIDKNNECYLGVSEMKDAQGCGRIVIENNLIKQSIEEKDCNEKQKEIKIVNAGLYLLPLNFINKYIFLINNNNKQNEYYLPDIIYPIIEEEKKIYPFFVEENEIINVNNREQLLKAKNSFNISQKQEYKNNLNSL